MSFVELGQNMFLSVTTPNGHYYFIQIIQSIKADLD